VLTAVFSDVHGNRVALEAMLEDLERRPADQLVCLGDALQGGPQPLECAERIAELGCPVVLGNADAFVLTLDPEAEPATEEMLETARWSQERLGERGLELIRGYEPTLKLELGAGRTLFAFHGSPGSYNEILLPSTPEDVVRAALEGADADVVAGGHVHMQWTRPISHKVLVNPGSVGLAYDHEQPEDDPLFEPTAEYAVISERLEIELRRVPFDPQAVVHAVEESGRPNAEEYVRGWRGASRRPRA
jgi:predicted phosphodiesterase